MVTNELLASGDQGLIDLDGSHTETESLASSRSSARTPPTTRRVIPPPTLSEEPGDSECDVSLNDTAELLKTPAELSLDDSLELTKDSSTSTNTELENVRKSSTEHSLDDSLEFTKDSSASTNTELEKVLKSPVSGDINVSPLPVYKNADFDVSTSSGGSIVREDIRTSSRAQDSSENISSNLNESSIDLESVRSLSNIALSVQGSTPRSARSDTNANEVQISAEHDHHISQGQGKGLVDNKAYLLDNFNDSFDSHNSYTSTPARSCSRSSSQLKQQFSSQNFSVAEGSYYGRFKHRDGTLIGEYTTCHLKSMLKH